jgi:hypothetical protein
LALSATTAHTTSNRNFRYLCITWPLPSAEAPCAPRAGFLLKADR